MPFGELQKLTGRAMYISQRLDLKAFEKTRQLASSPLIVSAGHQGAAVMFRYGVIVLFNLTPVEEVSFIKGLTDFAIEPFEHYEAEEVNLCLSSALSERMPGDCIAIDEFNLARLQVVASVLAKSVILSYYETAVAETFERIEPLAHNLQHGGKYMHKGRELLAHIGDVLMIQGRMVGRVEISEKPELLWDEPQYERLYLRMAEEYELIERHRALERKLDLVSKTAETLLDLLQNRRSHRVEWYIVILIVIEILLTVYEMWRQHLLG
ncbi:RMD1 family protein [Mariprofundus erugo]|uniref:RMD1 family protein n=1 Tax=Mariprofundus erugo TaxID=2528639 RepID=A0A5R9GSG2_9PROT|nr:RMD1 family protein [Mariprofundus erugo]TLS66992.1 RMD1 family protein [Mariprofundus erugo]TLS77306.1 RMD1 family protein [Mariprofundus erugo]